MCNHILFLIDCYLSYGSEEEVTVVYHFGFLIEFLHEAACGLDGLLLEHLLGTLLVELHTFTVSFLENLEEISTTVTLDEALAELTLLAGCDGTREGRLA